MRWRGAALAFVAGAFAVLAYPPVELAPAAFVAWIVLHQIWSREDSAARAAWTGLAFGLGFFLTGVSWVYISLSRFGAMPAPLAATATLGFCLWLSLFPAAVGWAQARLRVRSALVQASLLIPALWTIGEWLRRELFTGFPWLAAGDATIDTPLAGFVPVGGSMGAGFAALACAGLASAALRRESRVWAPAALAVVLAAGQATRSIEWTAPAGAPVTAALLQGNVPQDLKFEPARYRRTLDAYARLAGGTSARLVVFPETAIPRFFGDVDPGYVDRLESIARTNGSDLLVGVPRQEADGRYYNSVVSLGVSPRQWYDKSHLVPFGEFIPPGFGWVLRILAVPLSDFSRGTDMPPPLEVAGERVAVNICYEDAFGDEIRRSLPGATLLVNVSNVAWFGDSLAPAQHLGIARMRALETGRAVLTATNTGITAAIDRDGRVIARLEPFTEDRLETTVQGYIGATPYVRVGDRPALVLSLAIAGFALARRRSRAPQAS